jgi:hypothetical protein
MFFFETEAKELSHSLIKKKRVVQFIYKKWTKTRTTTKKLDHNTRRQPNTTDLMTTNTPNMEHLEYTDKETHSKK